MNTYRAARRSTTGRYEIHRDGCRHLTIAEATPWKSTLDVCGRFQAESAKAARDSFDTQDGMAGTTVAPCAKGA